MDTCYPENMASLDDTQIGLGLLDLVCSNLTGNQVTDAASSTGIDVGTGAEHLEIEGLQKPVLNLASGERLSVPCLNDSGASCDLHVVVRDAFNQTIVRGIDDASLELALLSDSIGGALKYTASNGVAVINSTFARGVNRSSNLTIISERHRRVRIQIVLNIRECLPGETEQQDLCLPCQKDQYGFDPGQNCHSCEENALCDGGAALVPKSGFWHSTPFSPVFRQCILPAACDYKARHRRLTQFYQNSSNLVHELESLEAFTRGEGPEPEFREYRQCAEGYEGLLCGSCSEGYGHSFTGECDRCPDARSKTSLFFIFRIAWILLLIGVNCGTTLSTMNTRVKVMKYEMRFRARPVLRRCRPFRMSTSFRRSSQHSSKALDYHYHVHPDFERLAANVSASGPIEEEEQALVARELNATVQLLEMLKARGIVVREALVQ